MLKSILILLTGFSLLSFTLQTQPNGAVQKTTYTQASPQFKAQLTAIYKSSLHLKEALISSDAKKAQQAAGGVKKALTQVDKTLLKDKAYAEWMSYQNLLNSSLDKIESENKLKSQRKYFAQFNDALYKSVKAFGIEETVYYQHCPMALDGQGAYWLSDSKQIRNPYLGDNMLTCGSTKEALK